VEDSAEFLVWMRVEAKLKAIHHEPGADGVLT